MKAAFVRALGCDGTSAKEGTLSILLLPCFEWAHIFCRPETQQGVFALEGKTLEHMGHDAKKVLGHAQSRPGGYECCSNFEI